MSLDSSPTQPRSVLRAFDESEAAGGAALIATAALALLAANLPATAPIYAAALHLETGPVIAPALGPMNVALWINDAAMTLFFLLVGLEVKRELVEGELSGAARRRLPFAAAAGGMVVPALVYVVVTAWTPGLHRGWAIPAATDIAFALGVLALLGRRVPSSLKLLLATIAIVDDIGAVAIIACVYTRAIDWPALAAAVGVLAMLVALNRRGIAALWPYLIGAVLLWWCVLLSEVHATIAGVMAAMVIPIRVPGPSGGSAAPLLRLERRLHPWVGYGVVPLFAFANAGVAFHGVPLVDPLVAAIVLGLFLGKQAGIFGTIWIADRIGFARVPAGVRWTQVYGLALVAGIGFTMSLFIGGLAFTDPALIERVKVGVLGGSMLSGAAGLIVLRVSGGRR